MEVYIIFWIYIIVSILYFEYFIYSHEFYVFLHL